MKPSAGTLDFPQSGPATAGPQSKGGCAAGLYHMSLGGDTPDDLRKALPRVRHVELAEPEGRTLPPANRHDFSGFFRVLREGRYAGTVSMEARWSEKDLGPAFAEVRRQWAAAG